MKTALEVCDERVASKVVADAVGLLVSAMCVGACTLPASLPSIVASDAGCEHASASELWQSLQSMLKT